MKSQLGQIVTRRRDGFEEFHRQGVGQGVRLVDFWAWSASDLLSNTTPGILAEFIVGSALGCVDGVREEWAAWDLRTASGISVEVKSSAYVQTWAQETLSTISFDIGLKQAWDPSTNEWSAEKRRHADLYVFCVLGDPDREAVDPMNLDQWRFHVLPTRVLNELVADQKTIRLSRLEELGAVETSSGELSEAIERVCRDR